MLKRVKFIGLVKIIYLVVSQLRF